MSVLVRGIARIWSILSIAVVVMFAVGEVGAVGPRPTVHEWVGLALWPIGVGLGLGIAWFQEVVGGSIALVCFVAFYCWNLLRSGHLPRGPFFALLSAPGLLFLIAGFLPGRDHPTGA